MLIHIIAQDIKYGLYQNRKKFLIFLIYMILISMGICFGAYLHKLGKIGLIGVICTHLFDGLPIYSYKAMTTFEEIEFPADWIVMVAFLPYLLGDYMYSDLQGFGVQKLLQSGRLNWWIGKCIWMFTTVIIYFLILFGVPFFVTTIFNGMNILPPSKDSWIFGGGFGGMYEEKSVFYMNIFVVPILCSTALAVWELVLGIMIKPARSYMFMAIYITLGVYYCSPYFIGNQLMLLRSEYIASNGLSMLTGIWIDIVLIIGGLLSGYFYIKKKDMI